VQRLDAVVGDDVGFVLDLLDALGGEGHVDGPAASAMNSLVPSTVLAACESKKSKKLVSRGRKRPNMAHS